MSYVREAENFDLKFKLPIVFIKSSATHLVMPTWIGVPMATITIAALLGSIGFSRLDSPSVDGLNPHQPSGPSFRRDKSPHMNQRHHLGWLRFQPPDLCMVELSFAGFATFNQQVISPHPASGAAAGSQEP